MTYLLLRLLKDDLKEYTYAARLAGLVYGVASGMNAILVSKPFEVWREVGTSVKGPLWGFGTVWKWLGFYGFLASEFDYVKCCVYCLANLKVLQESLLAIAFPANTN